MTAGDLPLRSLQEWFVHVTTEAESALGGLKRQANVVDPNRLDRVVRHGPHSTALERLGIYHRSYFSRLTECLADDYPALRFALGVPLFDEVCREYIDAFPSRDPNLNGFGRHLARFVVDNRGDLGPFDAELAQLEWALIEVLHARAPESFVAASLESLAPAPPGCAALPQRECGVRSIAPSALPHVRFEASPAVRMFSFAYPVNTFLRAFFRDQEPSRPDASASNVAVVRTGYQIWRLDLTPVAAEVLGRLMAGAPLGAALEGIDASPDDVQTWFQDWTTHGMFERVVVSDSVVA